MVMAFDNLNKDVINVSVVFLIRLESMPHHHEMKIKIIITFSRGLWLKLNWVKRKPPTAIYDQVWECERACNYFCASFMESRRWIIIYYVFQSEQIPCSLFKLHLFSLAWSVLCLIFCLYSRTLEVYENTHFCASKSMCNKIACEFMMKLAHQ